MVKHNYTPEEIKKLIVEAKESGKTDREVAKQFHKGKSTVGRIYERWKNDNSLQVHEKCGRRRKLTVLEERMVVRAVKANPTLTSSDVIKSVREDFSKEISTSTAQRLLQDKGLWGRRPSRKPMMSEKNRKARLAFAKKYHGIYPDEWKAILWSDWTKVNLVGSDGIRYVRRPKGKRNDRNYTVKTVKHGGGSIMLWGKLHGTLTLK